MNKSLVIRDEIHGDMTFDGLVRDVIDHESFQRLRYIKQLGLAEYVFPCANHTRFQHSLGAAYLTGHYYQSLLKSWLGSPFRGVATSGKTTLYGNRTYECVSAVAEHAISWDYWWQVASLAGLLHDIGHGPWSHSFEELELPQDFSSMTKKLSGVVGAHFRAIERSGARLMHEDLSVIYVHHLLSELEAEKYFLPVATLIHRKLATGAEKEISDVLKKEGVRGAADFHRLLRPIISGPFDVDRIDYIQRDGRNCGVSIGGIEWRRIVSKLVPCLADHQNSAGEPSDVCLISNVKNQHVLDDFIFSLFQMYTQVYMHPKIVGLEEIIKQILCQLKGNNKLTVTFDLHGSLSDEKFRELLKNEFGLTRIEDLMLRRKGAHFKVLSYPPDSGMSDRLKEEGYSHVDTQDRPMMKDSVGVFLFSALKKGEYHFEPWGKISPLARQFPSISYAPDVWVRMGD